MSKNLTDEWKQTARAALNGIYPMPQREEPGAVPLRKLVAAVFRLRYLILGTTLLGLLGGSFLAITTPNSFLSTGTFLLTTGAENINVDPTRAGQTSQETIATTAIYVLQADNLMRRVVERLGPARILAPYLPGTPDEIGFKAFFYKIQRDWNASDAEATAEDALKRLKRTIAIERPRSTEVLVATCTANDPVLAQEILTCYMEEARAFHLEQYDDPKVYQEIQRRAVDATHAQEAAQLRLRDFLERSAGVQDFDNELERLQAAEIDAATELQSRESKLLTTQKTIEALTRLLVGPDAIKQTREKRVQVGESRALARLRDQLSDKESTLALRRAALLNPDANEEIKALRREIDELKNAIAAATRSEGGDTQSVEQEPNPDYLKAQDKLAEMNIALVGDQTGVESAREHHSRMASALKKLIELQPEYEKLRLANLQAAEDVKNTQAAWQEAQRKALLKTGNFSSLKFIENPSLPLEKEAPNRGKLILGGLLGGLCLGFGLILLRSLADDVVRTRDDAERLDGLPVIGLIPRLDGRNVRRHQALREQGW